MPLGSPCVYPKARLRRGTNNENGSACVLSAAKALFTTMVMKKHIVWLASFKHVLGETKNSWESINS